MVWISDNGPGWRYGKMPFFGQPYHKNNSYSLVWLKKDNKTKSDHGNRGRTGLGPNI